MRIKIRVSHMMIVVTLLSLVFSDAAEEHEGRVTAVSQKEEDFNSSVDAISSEKAPLAKDIANSDPGERKLTADVDSNTDFGAWLDRMSKTSSAAPRRTAAKRKRHGRKSLEMLAKRNLRGTQNPPQIVVAKDGSGRVETVQAAVDLVPVNNKERIIIFIKTGVYREKVSVPNTKPFITFQGAGALLTIIEWGDTASTIGSNGKPLGTGGSASVSIEAANFIASDISFTNTAPPPPGGATGRQAVALKIQGDMAAFYNVNFYGAQDTLYDKEGRHYFFECFIQGSIDFIFGNGRSFYERCHLNSIASPFGSLTAQDRLTPNQDTGFAVYNSLVTGSGTIYLGRAWGPYSRVVYSYTFLGNIILPQGWFNWGVTARDNTVFYGEFKCYGPGANTLGRVKWSRQLTAAQAQPFLSIGFINGEQWL